MTETITATIEIPARDGVLLWPEEVAIGGSLDFTDCADLMGLPNGFLVSGYLDLAGTGIKALPERLSIGGSLYLEDNIEISALPANLTVGGCLFLMGCLALHSLPSGLTVGGDLYIEGTGITELPPDIKIGGNVYGLLEIP